MIEEDHRDKYLEDWSGPRDKIDWFWLFGRVLIPAVFINSIAAYFLYLVLR
jgi:hypothetical protein